MEAEQVANREELSFFYELAQSICNTTDIEEICK